MSVTAWIIVSWFLGLCAVVNVARQPGSAFEAAGHSKRFWLWVEVIGTVLSFTGILTWAVYTFGIRPSVVRAGGRRPTKGVFFRTFLRELASSPSSSLAPSGGASSGYGPAAKKPCGSCGGRGSQTCFSCSGHGRVSSPAYAANAVASANNWCSACSGSGKRRCDSCSGRGTV